MSGRNRWRCSSVPNLMSSDATSIPMLLARLTPWDASSLDRMSVSIGPNPRPPCSFGHAAVYHPRSESLFEMASVNSYSSSVPSSETICASGGSDGSSASRKEPISFLRASCCGVSEKSILIVPPEPGHDSDSSRIASLARMTIACDAAGIRYIFQLCSCVKLRYYLLAKLHYYWCALAGQSLEAKPEGKPPSGSRMLLRAERSPEQCLS